MPDGDEQLTVRTIDRIARLDAAEWDRCAGGRHPFVGYAFLNALEESGSVNAESGWLPQHLVLEDAAGTVLGAAPMYVKTHSQGEYVFDYGWADAYERAGGRYYPKLQVSVPFTPVTGPRLLVPEGPRQTELRAGLLNGMVQAAQQIGVTNLHITFPTAPEAELMEAAGLLIRHGYQFHWENDGYATFDDFLGALASRKRKAIRKERASVEAAGIRVRALTGGDIRSEHWDVFHRFYVSTYDRKWGYPYLTRAFFDQISAVMPDQIVLVMADRGGDYVAGALNLLGDDAIYGRNWGCAGDFKFLHFEACYYQAIDFAIERGLARVEAGTQGPHKVQRGYLPKPTYSAHWLQDRRFRDAVERFVDEERRAIEHEMAVMAEHSPFRNDDGRA